MGLMGMAQVVATIAYGIRGLRRGETTWDWPDFNAIPEQENLAQMSRWSLNSTPAWDFPPSQSQTNTMTNRPIRWSERDIVWYWYGVRSCVAEERSPPRSQGRASSWTQMDSCAESPVPGSRSVCLRSWSHAFPTYVCLPSGLYKARTGQIVAQTGPEQESYLCQVCTSLMDGGYI